MENKKGRREEYRKETKGEEPIHQYTIELRKPAFIS